MTAIPAHLSSDLILLLQQNAIDIRAFNLAIGSRPDLNSQWQKLPEDDLLQR